MRAKPELKVLSDFDNGGRRSGVERRKFSYTLHLPERRSGGDRREFANHHETSPEEPDDEHPTIQP
jgi:hypothetical protein